jgi:hypothetical protein
MRSFEVGSSTSGMADMTVCGDPCFISCGVMASDPYRRRKGVNPVALHSVVFSAQTASGNRSAHLPFLSSRSIFLTAVKILPLARSTTPLDCGWYTEAKGLGANGEAEILEVLTVKLLAIVNCELGWDCEAANNVLPEEFLGSLRCYS